MTGDFSIIRLSKKQEQEKNYRKVLLQQGRVLTDADWNELVDSQVLHDIKSLSDIIGQNGIPLELHDSFKITPIDGKRYTIGKGRIYVDGILVENFSDVEAAFQPYLPSVTDMPQEGIEKRKSEAIPTEKGIYLAYLDIWYRHITYLEDPEILESALGGPDTTTRMQVVWQVKIHKLNDKEEKSLGKEYKWTPWVPLQNTSNDKVSDIRVASSNDNSLLEVFALLDSGINAPIDRGIRVSKRELSLDLVKWEEDWNKPSEDSRFLKFELAFDDEGLLEMFAIDANDSTVIQSIRRDNLRWGGIDKHWTIVEDKPFKAKYIAVGKNENGNLELFAIRAVEDGKIYHSKQKQSNLADWSGLKPIGWKLIDNIDNMPFDKISVTSNPKDHLLEIYAIGKTDNTIWFTTQDQPNSLEWDENWKKIGTDSDPTTNPKKFVEIAVNVNRYDQVVVFASDLDLGSVWVTLGGNSSPSPSSSVNNKWVMVGNSSPGKLISRVSVQANIKKQGRLELFAVFSDPQNPSPTQVASGKVWTISENEDGSWSSEWQLFDKLNATKVSSAVDKLSRLNVFAVESEKGVVHHSYVEEIEKVMPCDMDIQSWISKIKPSSIQLKARTRPERPPLPSDSCMLPENAGYRKLENQLYRIEIHQKKSNEKNPTFKYSQDNGIICSKILDISADKITVASVGKDSLLSFHGGKWAEITDELHELWGIPGVLVFIKEVKDMDLVFDTSDPLVSSLVNNTNFPAKFNPKARQWDSPGDLEIKNLTENDGFVKIEDESGIEVKFNQIDDCKTGDYYTIPARTLKADIEWPKGTDGLPEFVDAEGIAHHYAVLAFLRFTDEDKLEVISDCRKFFAPLTDLISQTQNAEAKSMIWWIHGTISHAEDPSQLSSSLYAGNGTIYKQRNNSNKFHFPMSVSYLIDQDKKATTIEKMSILFRTSVGTKISEIVIYDGAKPIPIPKLADLSLSGIHDEKPDDSNTFTLDPPIEVQYGIGVSVNVMFSSPNALGEITFTSLGLQLKTI